MGRRSWRPSVVMGRCGGVASVLAGKPIPLGLLPGGTGNLLARNLGVPLDLRDAVAALLSGGERKIDTAVAHFMRKDGSRFTERFLVMAGIGLDAEIMSSTSEELKSKVGWLAYVFSAIPRLSHRGFRARLTDPSGETKKLRCQLVVFGNCGTITGGFKIMPDARVDDGLVDALVVSVDGLLRWPVAMASLLTSGPDAERHIKRGVSPAFRLGLRRARRAEVDGDPVGKVVNMAVETDAQSLTVRVPAEETAQPTREGRR